MGSEPFGKFSTLLDSSTAYEGTVRPVMICFATFLSIRHGTQLLAALSLVAAIRASNWWYLGVAMSSGTMAFFTCRLSE